MSDDSYIYAFVTGYFYTNSKKIYETKAVKAVITFISKS